MPEDSFSVLKRLFSQYDSPRRAAEEYVDHMGIDSREALGDLATIIDQLLSKNHTPTSQNEDQSALRCALELAKQNVLRSEQAETPELEAERERQLEAVEALENLTAYLENYAENRPVHPDERELDEPTNRVKLYREYDQKLNVEMEALDDVVMYVVNR